MKRFYKSLSVLILLLLFNSCTKEVSVNSSFDFELYQQTYTKQIVINLPSKNVIEINMPKAPPEYIKIVKASA